MVNSIFIMAREASCQLHPTQVEKLLLKFWFLSVGKCRKIDSASANAIPVQGAEALCQCLNGNVV